MHADKPHTTKPRTQRRNPSGGWVELGAMEMTITIAKRPQEDPAMTRSRIIISLFAGTRVGFARRRTGRFRPDRDQGQHGQD